MPSVCTLAMPPSALAFQHIYVEHARSERTCAGTTPVGAVEPCHGSLYARSAMLVTWIRWVEHFGSQQVLTYRSASSDIPLASQLSTSSSTASFRSMPSCDGQWNTMRRRVSLVRYSHTFLHAIIDTSCCPPISGSSGVVNDDSCSPSTCTETQRNARPTTSTIISTCGSGSNARRRLTSEGVLQPWHERFAYPTHRNLLGVLSAR